MFMTCAYRWKGRRRAFCTMQNHESITRPIQHHAGVARYALGGGSRLSAYADANLLPRDQNAARSSLRIREYPRAADGES